MCGGYPSVIGIRREQALQKFLTGRPQRFEPSKEGLALSWVFIEVDAKTGRAQSIKRGTLVEENVDEQ